jgi:hypothetical protein
MSIPKKPRTCRVCRQPFQPVRCLQTVCSPDCAIKQSQAKRAKSERIAGIEDRKATAAKLEKLKTPQQKRAALIQAAEKAIRDYRRTYELMKGSGCISCGRSQQEVIGTDGWKPGGAFDAGHYHGKGARPNLRLTPDNIWLQCKSCNGGSSKYARKGATVAKQYRENLIIEVGLARVEELDADDLPRHWPDEELIQIIDTYKQKTKELKRV